MSDSKDGPLITTVIPTYRRPRLLRRAIGSVLAQTYPHSQVCVYDNASGDRTGSVVAELAKRDPRVKYHCHPENIGAFKNFVYGMEHVDTPFFSFLSDDDILLPRFYEVALAGFEKHREAMLSVLVTIHVDARGRILDAPVLKWRPGLYCPPEGLLAMLRYGHPVWTSILFRREVLDKVGGLDEETGGGRCDQDFEQRAAARFPLVVTLQPGAMLAIHPASHSRKSGVDSLWPGWLKIIRNLVEDEQIPERVRRYASQALTDLAKNDLFLHGYGSVVRRDWDDAYRSAEVLRNHYHLKGRALILRASARACRSVPLAHYVLRILNALRKLPRQIKSRRLQREYGTYATLLEP